MRLAPLPTLSVLLASALAAPPLGAQLFPEEGTDPNDGAAYFALASTPLGALPPIVSSDVMRATPRRLAVRALFGYLDEDGPFSRRVFGAGLDVPLGRSTVAVTAGYNDIACDIGDLAGAGVSVDCGGAIIGGASYTVPVLAATFGAAERTSLVLGADAAIGFGTRSPVEWTVAGADTAVRTRTLSAGLGLPLALVARSGRLTITPHLTPRVAWGRTRYDVDADSRRIFDLTESGTRFLLGGGLAFRLDGPGLAFHVGFQRIFFEGANTLIGAGLSLPLR
jgi:hypothetical protein